MRRREEPVVLVEREGSASVVWFLIGGAVGATLALLFAPHSGDHTRRVLGRRLNKLRDAADQTISDLKGALSREAGPDGREPAGDDEIEEEDLDEPESEGTAQPEKARRTSVSAARRELEQRLAEARARRRRALADEDEEPVA